MSDKYDLVVIGSGPAGEKGAAQAAYFGKRVALIERNKELGGACAVTGTLPSKTLRESALFLSGLRQREIYGVSTSVKTQNLSVSAFMAHKDRVVQAEIDRIHNNLHRHKIELIKGTASLVDPHTVRVALTEGGTRELSASVILIATGSSPWRPPSIPFSDPDIDDSDKVLTLDRIPNHFIVLGGGVIGCEYASIFAALGISKVTIIEGRDRLLGFLDPEIGDILTASFRRLGMEVILKDKITKYDKPSSGRGVRVTLESGRVLEADRLLAAAGRSSNVEGMNLEGVGVKMGERGKIEINENFQTSVPHIYAAGDVVGWPSLAATSMEQGRVAMCHAFQLSYKTRMAETFPYGLYTIPEVSICGLSEEEARRKHPDVEVGKAFYRDNARGQIVNDPEGILKLVFDAKTKKLYGVHILGERATELIHIGQSVMVLDGTIDYFIQTVFNYPTLSEIYKYAAYDGLGRVARRGQSSA
ncbi:Si-specific NAD(P)(+) transhydrogenase [Haliangium sp. UPWRP_2]|uniref:Si-specific NAD(P)(+) transhydrogenase n=1 Tax=Haliangium sp. UPWRP_2 TaxID=1931276 RepID=UPI0018EC0E7A|nr:Si-specific NAD(P)(+) transhydrogenase [Haliangium sp. UPWRP_2]